MAKDKFPKKTWDRIQALYEAGVPIAQISRDFKVSRTGITKRADKHGWVRGSSEQDVNERTVEVVNGVAGLSDATTREKAIDDIAQQRAKLIKLHRDEWTELEKLDKEILACIYDKNYKPTFWEDWTVTEWTYAEDGSLVKDEKGNPVPAKRKFTPFDAKAREKRTNHLQQLYKSRAEAFVTKQEGQRRSYGFDYKMQVEDSGKKDEGFEKRAEKLRKLVERMQAWGRSKPMPKPQEGDLPR